MKPKTFLYVLIAIAIIAVIAFVVYQFAFRKNDNTTAGTGQAGLLPTVVNQQFPTGGQVSGATGLTATSANASSSQFGVVSTDPALDYFVNTANTVSLIKPDGTIESIVNGKTSIVGSSTISNIISAAFSYDGKKVLVSSRAGTTTLTSAFDLTQQTWTRLPDNIQSPVWSPVNYQVAYLTPSNSGSEVLATIDAGTLNAKPTTITTLAMEDMILQWPNQNTMVVSDRPSAYTAGSVWLFTISSKTLSSAAFEDFGAESLWNASSSALIFSAGSNNAGGQLAFRDNTGIQKNLSFTTLPSKCAFGPAAAASGTANPSSFVYCGVPSDQTTLSVARLPDEYDQNIYFTNDNIYRIDTGAGSLTEIFSSSAANQSIDAAHMKVFNNVLFFINRYDQKVYALTLQ